MSNVYESGRETSGIGLEVFGARDRARMCRTQGGARAAPWRRGDKDNVLQIVTSQQ